MIEMHKLATRDDWQYNVNPTQNLDRQGHDTHNLRLQDTVIPELTKSQLKETFQPIICAEQPESDWLHRRG